MANTSVEDPVLPDAEAPRPASGTVRPPSGSVRPTSGSQRPTSGSQRPASGSELRESPRHPSVASSSQLSAAPTNAGNFNVFSTAVTPS